MTWSVLDHEREPKAGYGALAAACAPVIVVADRPEPVRAGASRRARRPRGQRGPRPPSTVVGGRGRRRRQAAHLHRRWDRRRRYADACDWLGRDNARGSLMARTRTSRES